MNSLPEKLLDCTDHGWESELFIVEGDSAARAVNRLRDVARQAVLPMQGKPMNAMKSSLKNLQRNLQFAALIRTLGVRLSESTDPDLSQIRYGRIVLLFDPDADGIHGRTLMLLFFYRWLSALLEAGRVFDAHAPLWEITADGLNEPVYAYSDNHLVRVREQLRKCLIESHETQRFRGLGNIDGPLLSKLCLDPETRHLTPLTVMDAETAMTVFQQMREFR